MSILWDASPSELEYLRAGGPLGPVQLRCSECDQAIEGLTEQDAGCGSEDVDCERCFQGRMGWPDKPEEEMPF